MPVKKLKKAIISMSYMEIKYLLDICDPSRNIEGFYHPAYLHEDCLPLPSWLQQNFCEINLLAEPMVQRR